MVNEWIFLIKFEEIIILKDKKTEMVEDRTIVTGE